MTTQELHTALLAALASVERPGDFATHGELPCPLLGLEAQGVGPIALPLLPVQAQALTRVAERAPYGRGGETLVDTDVRRVWQVAPEQLSLDEATIRPTLDAILKAVGAGLGIKAEIDAELYKLLLYDAGSFFLPHRDTEKAAGMFATLVIVLPSTFEGGALRVRHAGGEERIALKPSRPTNLAFAAFYTDCEHEIEPLQDGHRLALVYNLTRRGKRAPLLAPDHGAAVHTIADLLQRAAALMDSPEDDGTGALTPIQALGQARIWEEESEEEEDSEEEGDSDEGDAWGEESKAEDALDEPSTGSDSESEDSWGEDSWDEDPWEEEASATAPRFTDGAIPTSNRLLYVLEHRYSPAGLAWAGLKGADAARAGVLRQAAEAAGWVCSLAMISIAESGGAEYLGGYGYRRGRRGRSYGSVDSDNPEDYEVIEVHDREATLGDWILAEGPAPSLPSMDFSEEEVFPPDALKDAEPDEQYFTEASGNAGASFERTYRFATLVLWPRAHHQAILLGVC